MLKCVIMGLNYTKCIEEQVSQLSKPKSSISDRNFFVGDSISGYSVI